ncbi:Organ specific protein [Caenorhabditis elegans]|uniref:Organ specific protein n=1 Tax=Caenorhabditis elegans TaxID=6239 RepID=O02069_CAEEL|nr:Organ specific protein [Caenorhabditis elegans]CCD69696.1 Organ specific protein [Caenorhabditis elegans]|eukprot:NP_494607.1 Uncharacterized protein CELE_F19B10.6 [Caenorhabditis elegans]
MASSISKCSIFLLLLGVLEISSAPTASKPVLEKIDAISALYKVTKAKEAYMKAPGPKNATIVKDFDSQINLLSMGVNHPADDLEPPYGSFRAHPPPPNKIKFDFVVKLNPEQP